MNSDVAPTDRAVPASSRISPFTLLRFLVGQRQAILAIAAAPGVLWLGLLLVLSAAFAREYDGEDLLHAPWHLLLPAAASLLTSGLLFATLWLASRGGRPRISTLPSTYRSFLGLYWMTAPLAWLYAIPVERWWSAQAATEANLWLLGIVALWRVLLMVRVVTVLYGATTWRALCVVMLFADTLALVLLRLTPLPVFSIMGGIRLTDSERMIQSTAFLVGAAGILSFPIWFFGTIVAAWRKGFSWNVANVAAAGTGSVAPTAWALAVASLLVWIPVLPMTQPEQQLRRTVETQLRQGSVREALAIMNAHDRGDFPPHWDPPPRIGYGERHPHLFTVIEAAMATPSKPWVVDLFLDKLHSSAGVGFGAYFFFADLDDDALDRYLRILEQLPADSTLIAQQREALANLARDNSGRPEQQRLRIRRLLERPAR